MTASGTAGQRRTFWVCKCGRPLYDHGRLGKDGNQIWMGCAATGCKTFRASDGSGWPNVNMGATLADPADLDVDTEHWIGGEVVLSAAPGASRRA